jgi:hypothetical protein
MRSILTIAAIIFVGSCLAASRGAAQLSPGNPALAAYTEYRQSKAEYNKCLADNPTNKDACEEQRRIMDNNAQVWSGYPESQTQSYFGKPLGPPGQTQSYIGKPLGSPSPQDPGNGNDTSLGQRSKQPPESLKYRSPELH